MKRKTLISTMLIIGFIAVPFIFSPSSRAEATSPPCELFTREDAEALFGEEVSEVCSSRCRITGRTVLPLLIHGRFRHHPEGCHYRSNCRGRNLRFGKGCF